LYVETPKAIEQAKKSTAKAKAAKPVQKVWCTDGDGTPPFGVDLAAFPDGKEKQKESLAKVLKVRRARRHTYPCNEAKTISCS